MFLGGFHLRVMLSIRTREDDSHETRASTQAHTYQASPTDGHMSTSWTIKHLSFQKADMNYSWLGCACPRINASSKSVFSGIWFKATFDHFLSRLWVVFFFFFFLSQSEKMPLSPFVLQATVEQDSETHTYLQ